MREPARHERGTSAAGSLPSVVTGAAPTEEATGTPWNAGRLERTGSIAPCVVTLAAVRPSVSGPSGAAVPCARWAARSP